jgi:hypothetical protein
MSDDQDDDAPMTAAEKRAAVREEKAAAKEEAAAAEAEANKPAPPPIAFAAHDRFHAITHIVHHLVELSDELKARLVAALNGMTGQGPVHVEIPAQPGAGDLPSNDSDLTHPADGAFAIEPFQFVKV